MDGIRAVRKNVIERAEVSILGKQRFFNKEMIKDRYCSKCSNKGNIKTCRLENDDIDNMNCKRFKCK